MKESIKQARLAALLGLEAPKEPTRTEREHAIQVSREAEAVIMYATTPQGFKERDCKTCGHRFAVNRASIAFCSDLCRREHLGSLGIDWDPNRTPEDRWNFRTGGLEPLVVPPAALTLVQELLNEATGEAV